jgi:hypothetical protein
METWLLRRLRAAIHNWRSDCPYSIRQMLDHRNRALYKWVSRRAPILLSRSKEGSWEGSLRLTDRMGIVAATESQHPCASFACKLLHIKLQLNGLIKPKVVFVAGLPHSGTAKSHLEKLVIVMCDDLAHHRLYGEFLGLGYLPNEFMLEEDSYVTDHLTKWEKTWAAGSIQVTRLAVALRYLATHNPQADSEPLQARLLAVVNQEQIACLDQVLADWKASRSQDYSAFLARIFRCSNMKGIGFQCAGNPIVWT